MRASQGATGSWTAVWDQLLGSAGGDCWWGCVWDRCSGLWLGAVQDSTHEYVGGERITVKKS